jgi:hypothetical protein
MDELANVIGTMMPPATVQPAATWLSAVDAPVVVFEPVNDMPCDALNTEANDVLFTNEYKTMERFIDPDTLVVAKAILMAISISDKFMYP